MLRRSRRCPLVVFALASVVTASACGGDDEADREGKASGAKPTVVKGAGNIRPLVDQFRKRLGPDNGGGPRGDPAGRREIDWDKVPDEFASPNELPGGFFNAKEEPTARGAVLTTPGDNVAVSADSQNPAGAPPRFGDINPEYTHQFETFSKERLFSPVGSNVVDLKFVVPGTASRAAVRGFGAVYTDVDRKENTAFEYFDAAGKSLGQFATPVSKGGLSFLGVVYPKAVVARVRIEYGSGKLGPDETADYDVAVMDDFIYGEPRPVR